MNIISNNIFQLMINPIFIEAQIPLDGLIHQG